MIPHLYEIIFEDGPKMSSGKFSIVMATLNSMATIERSLNAIKKQNYPASNVDVMVIDGGSTDGTREMAARFGCRVIDNPRVDPVSAKLIGLREAKGDYLMHVDSDEVLLDSEALMKRARAFQENPEVRMVFSSGYKDPEGVSFAATYINEFGDPFSMFFYRLTKNAKFFTKTLRKRMKCVRESESYAIFDLSEGSQPILENAACGNCIDLTFFRTNFPELCDKPWGPVHFFYHMQKYTRKFAVIKDDPILHFSADSWSGFFRKIKWRVRNNVFFSGEMASAGFKGREQFDSSFARYKKYLYIPYAFTVIPASIDAVYLAWTRRDWRYLSHVPLTLYTAGMIVGMMGLKVLGYRPELKSYGEQKTISLRK